MEMREAWGSMKTMGSMETVAMMKDSTATVWCLQYGDEGGLGEYEDYGQYGDSSYDEGQYSHSVVPADGGKGTLNFSQYIQKLPENGPKAQQCTICGKGFSDLSSALKHVENIHFPGSFIYS